jgi:N-acylneuraminate cytidylyltransferase
MDPTTIAFVFARGGSKGLPGKNIRPLGGKPLIAHSIDIARQCARISRVIVSTDDPAIADAARAAGAEVPFTRPAELATDTASEWLARRHAIDKVEASHGRFDVFVSLPATSPLRAVDDVERSLDALDESTDMVITVKPAERSPFFNMVQMDSRGYCALAVEPTAHFARRQDAPALYDITTVAYVARPAFVRHAGRMFDGRVKAVLVPPERAVDIDNELDFRFAQFLLERSR